MMKFFGFLVGLSVIQSLSGAFGLFLVAVAVLFWLSSLFSSNPTAVTIYTFISLAVGWTLPALLSFTFFANAASNVSARVKRDRPSQAFSEYGVALVSSFLSLTAVSGVLMVIGGIVASQACESGNDAAGAAFIGQPFVFLIRIIVTIFAPEFAAEMDRETVNVC